MNENQSVGVVIGRFQTPQLTKGHLHLINYALDRHDHVIVVIGSSGAQPTKRNPLDYPTRRAMTQYAYPQVETVQVVDHISDEYWSERIDQKVGEDKAVLYCSRDGFKQLYSGKHEVVEIPPYEGHNATTLREECAKEPLDTIDFRRGAIYAIHNRIPSPYMAVDVAPMKDGCILLGRKAGETELRFIGGHLDSTDSSIWWAASRELKEEAQIIATKFEIIGECKVNDWRYARDEESIFTLLYLCEWVSGDAKADDDIVEVHWIPIHEFRRGMVKVMPAHQNLLEILTNHLSKIYV